MNEALRGYGRTVAIFAAAGLVLSLLVGVLAGNPFGIILLRALLFAFAFGGVGAGLQYVVMRFLPELAGAPTPDAAGSAESADAGAKPEGSTIDIVLPEEPMPAGDDVAAAAEPLEELPGSIDAPIAESDGPPAGVPAGGSSGGSSGGSVDEAAAMGGSGGLDFLPDIGSLESGEPTPRAAAPRRDRTRPADATRDVLERQDPAQLARGLRTMLKRDERS